MLAGECRALRGDGRREPAQMTADAINLPFHQQRLPRIQNGAFGFVQAEQNAAFAKDRCFRRVDVFADVFVVALQYTPAEANSAAQFVADGEHHAPAKAVVEMAGLIAHQQAGGFHGLPFDGGARPGLIRQKTIPFRRPTDTPLFPHIQAQLAPVQVIARGRGIGALNQFFQVAFGRGFIGGKQLVLGRAFPGATVRFLQLQRNAGTARQHPHRRGKVHVVIEHHKFENIAASPAAETVERLPRRIDVERRRFFLVERAQRFGRVACALELNVGTYYVGDVQRLADLVNRILGDHGRHGRLFLHRIQRRVLVEADHRVGLRQRWQDRVWFFHAAGNIRLNHPCACGHLVIFFH